MKFIFVLFLLVAFVPAKTQNPLKLVKVEAQGTRKVRHGIIFGLFVQRLGFTSGGFPQYIIIRNIDSSVTYTFRVKDTFKSARKNSFCYYIPPGEYIILNYQWTDSKWYGGKQFMEPIRKLNAENAIISTENDSATMEDIYFRFHIEPGSITYVGNWNFDKPGVSFSDEKDILVLALQKAHKKIDFSAAKVSIPK